jgi:hypothetical protein
MKKQKRAQEETEEDQKINMSGYGSQADTDTRR